MADDLAERTNTLSEKERETLRLLLHGHDAKSAAQMLDLSVHTVNERLRHARRKLGVTSSKEAARVLREWESGHSQLLVYSELGEAAAGTTGAQGEPSGNGWKARIPRAALLAGGLVMSIFFAVLALGVIPAGGGDTLPLSQVQVTEAETAAREWLELVDAGNAQESYARTGHAFRALNAPEVWQRVMASVRTPLGATVSRRLVAVQSPDRPEGYTDVVFETVFANRTGAASETVTLARDDGEWRVVGIVLE